MGSVIIWGAGELGSRVVTHACAALPAIALTATDTQSSHNWVQLWG